MSNFVSDFEQIGVPKRSSMVLGMKFWYDFFLMSTNGY